MMHRRRLVQALHQSLDRCGLLRTIGPASRAAAILMYHRINDHDSNGLTTPTRTFDHMIRELKKRFSIVALAELVRDVRLDRPLGNCVAITFDDGYRDNLLCAAPILQKHGVPATFFITSGYIGTQRIFPWDASSAVPNPIMNWDEVRQLANMGFDIGAHTVNHLDLGKTATNIARNEIRESKIAIEEQLRKPIEAFAFPFGKRTSCPEVVSKIVAEEGFASCCLGYGGKVRSNSDVFRLNRIPMYPTTAELLMDIDGLLSYYDGIGRFVGIPVIRHNVEEW